MTAVLDTPTSARVASCRNPEKLTFATEFEALAEAAAQDAKHGIDTHTPYECVGHWHNTTSDDSPPKPLRTSSRRIDRAALNFPKAPLKPSTELTAGFIVLTPKIAAYWLREFNTHNRNLRPRGVSSLAIDIITGGWDLNGAAITFDAERRMIDGQHRCSAVVESGIPVPVVLVTGLEPAAQDTVDTGMRRSFADTLKLAGESDPLKLAGVVAQVCRWKAGQIRGNTKTNLSVKVLQRVLRDHPEIRSAVPIARRINARVATGPASILGLAWWLFNAIDPEECADFFEKLCDGSGLEKTDPIWKMREALIDNAATRRKLTKVEMLAYLIKSWNYYRSGQQVQQLSWRAGGKRPEPFPTPR